MSRLTKSSAPLPPEKQFQSDHAIFANPALLLDTVMSNLPIGIGFLDTDFRYILVNEFLARIHRESAASHRGKVIFEYVPGFTVQYKKILEQIISTGLPEPGPEIRLGMAPDEERWTAIYHPVINLGEVVGIFEVISKVVASNEAVESFRHQALHDPLTTLPNRTLLKVQLAHTLHSAQKNGTCLAVLFIDLDRFKAVNDSLGHSAGDRLLQLVGDRLNKAIRQGDIVGRLGGDEFMVLLTHIKNARAAIPAAQRMLRSIRGAYHIDGQVLRMNASIGVSLYPHDGDNAEMLLRNADTAMYRAKESGGNNMELFNPIGISPFFGV